MPETQRIQDQLRRALEGEAWHGPCLLELLAGVTPDRAAAKPLPAVHSIWEIVLHVTAWVKAVHGALNGKLLELSTEQDWPPVGRATAVNWNTALQALKDAHAQLQQAISRLDDRRLDEKAPGKDYSIYFMLHGVIQHDLYHAGQIAILKRSP